MRGFTWVYLDWFGDSNKYDPALVLGCSGKLYEETENKSVPLAFSFADSERASIISSSLFFLSLWSYDSSLQWWIHAWIAGNKLDDDDYASDHWEFVEFETVFDELQAFDFNSWKLVLIFVYLAMNRWICDGFCSNLWGIGVILCLLWWPEFCYGGFCGGWNVCYGGEGFWGERENWLEFLMMCPFWNGESDTCAVKIPFYNLPCGLLGQ
jgi:hypothetical protein